MRYRVLELFSGVGSQRMALKRLSEKRPELQFEFVAQCDIDKYAVKSYNAIHGETPNLGDITKLEQLPECDILTWSYPCTSVSMAGKKEGMEKGSGTASSLAWEVIRLLNATEHKPEWLLMENVPAVTYKTNIGVFNQLIQALSDMGYASRYKIINATEFDVAQNRKRCFMISHYKAGVPEFPTGPGLTHRLKDYLEENVDQKYYLSRERLKGLIVSTQREREREGTGTVLKLPIQEQKPNLSRPQRDTGSTTRLFLSPTGRRTYHNQVFLNPIESPPLCASDHKDPPKIIQEAKNG